MARLQGSPIQPAFLFAHGGKDGHPFPVPVKVYDETIGILQHAVHKAKIGYSVKAIAIKKLYEIAACTEHDFLPGTGFEEWVQNEKNDSWKYGEKTVKDDAVPPRRTEGTQLKLF